LLDDQIKHLLRQLKSPDDINNNKIDDQNDTNNIQIVRHVRSPEKFQQLDNSPLAPSYFYESGLQVKSSNQKKKYIEGNNNNNSKNYPKTNAWTAYRYFVPRIRVQRNHIDEKGPPHFRVI